MPPDKERIRPRQEADSRSKAATKTSDPSLAELLGYLDAIQRRVVHEAMTEARRSYWLRRAADFRAALPRQSDWHGHEGFAAVHLRRRRLEQIIFACEAKAEIAIWQDDDLKVAS